MHKIERNFLSELTRPTDFATFSCNAFIDVITVLSEVNNTLLNDTLLKNAVLLANGNIAFSIKLAFLSEVDALLFKLDKVLSNDGVNTLLDDGLFNNNSRSLSAELPEDADEALEDAGVLSEIAIDTALSDDDDEALKDAGMLSEITVDAALTEDANEALEDAGVLRRKPEYTSFAISIFRYPIIVVVSINTSLSAEAGVLLEIAVDTTKSKDAVEALEDTAAALEDPAEALENAGVLSKIAVGTALADDDDEALEDAGVLSEFDGNELPEDAGIAGKEPLKNIVTLSGVANTLFTDVITLGTVDLFSNT